MCLIWMLMTALTSVRRAPGVFTVSNGGATKSYIYIYIHIFICLVVNMYIYIYTHVFVSIFYILDV